MLTPQVEKLLKQASIETDTATLIKLLAEINRMLQEKPGPRACCPLMLNKTIAS